MHPVGTHNSEVDVRGVDVDEKTLTLYFRKRNMLRHLDYEEEMTAEERDAMFVFLRTNKHIVETVLHLRATAGPHARRWPRCRAHLRDRSARQGRHRDP